MKAIKEVKENVRNYVGPWNWFYLISIITLELIIIL